MNKIQQLADIAKNSVPKGILTPDKWIEEYNKIFAELIIKECLTIVEGYCETSPEIYGLPLDILEHFDMELNDDTL